MSENEKNLNNETYNDFELSSADDNGKKVDDHVSDSMFIKEMTDNQDASYSVVDEEKEKFKDVMDDEYEEFETIVMTDEDTGEDIEFAIIDSVQNDGFEYLLVVESEAIDDEESEAMLLKKMTDNHDITYAVVEDEEEFDLVAALFQRVNDEYELELED